MMKLCNIYMVINSVKAKIKITLCDSSNIGNMQSGFTYLCVCMDITTVIHLVYAYIILGSFCSCSLGLQLVVQITMMI